MSNALTETARLPAPAPAQRRERAATPALSLQVGFVTTFLLVIVVMPIAAVVWKSTGQGWAGFWEVVSSPQAVAAFKLTLITSTLAVLTTAVFGTIIAWVLVRDSFAGKSVVNAIIDLPFALPTIVAGLVIMALYGPRTPLDFTIGSFHFDANVTFTRGAIYIALLFVTLPFVVRAVQPVLIEFDQELEDAARSLGAGPFATFRRVVLPVILPGILSGVAMAFARAVGEIGAIVLIAGNLPFRTEVASIHLFYRIEQDPAGSAAIAVVLLLISFTALMGIGVLRWYVTRHDRG
ncbi:MAG TPA: sulfate ABC transporter permease subunit CysT [Gaiella sp.]|nr:sulfate ABC transporter permease subunit CysT [Gaiella sp.]